jgi:hypothetical protein
MRTLWQGLVRIVFWSFERGTWPYDVAVALIVVFVLLSPRSWFNDRPPLDPPPAQAMVEMRGADPADGGQIYRVDARLVPPNDARSASQLERQLYEAVRQHTKRFRNSSSFEVLRITPVRGRDGAITFYDVCIKP